MSDPNEILSKEHLIHGTCCSSGEGYDITVQLLVKLHTRTERTERRTDSISGKEYDVPVWEERALTEDERKLCQRTMWDMESKLFATIVRGLPDTLERQKRWREKLPQLFAEAGLSPIYIEEIPNEYTTAGWETPWALVTTSFGHVKIGWRKSVLVIDWSRTRIDKSGEVLFPNEDVTKGGAPGDYTREKYSYIHAWGYEKAVEYLKRLKATAEVQP